MFGWFRRVVRYPKLIFEMVEGGRVNVVADWPGLVSVEEQLRVAKELAMMAFYINSGQLLSLMQQAMAVSGKLKNEERVSEQILSILNTVLHRVNGDDNNLTDDGPVGVVSPDEVFSR